MKNDHKFDLGWISRYRSELFGISILSIMLFHFTADFGHAVSHGVIDIADFPIKCELILGYLRVFGSIGVEVFVFLSGMGLYYSFTKDDRLGNFYKKRFQRILIPYLIVGIIFWVIKDFYYNNANTVTFLKDMTFYSLPSRGVHTLWFIGLMLGLYIVFPVIFKMLDSEHYRTLNFIILLAVTYGFPVLIYFLNNEVSSNSAIATTRIPLFVIGCYMGRYIKEGRKLPWPSAVIFVAVSFMMKYTIMHFDTPPFFGRYFSGIYSLGLIITVVTLLHLIRNWNGLNAVLRWFGKYSLEIYLTHVSLRNLMKEAGFHAYRISQYGIMLIIAVILAVGLSKLTDVIEGKNRKQRS